jgi:propanol-preferring alcohol dehydrogenase
MVVPLDRLTIVPDGVDAMHAAPMACAVGTAYRATITKGGVAAGSRVAMIGLGGVGIHALQLARAAGADAVGFDISEKAVDAARRVGCKAIVIPTAAPSMPAQYQECFDVVVDVVGASETMEHARQLLRPGGRIVAVGYSARSSFEFDPTRFVLEEVEVVGSRGFQMAELERAMQLVAEGAVQVVVDRVTPFEAAFEAYTALAAGEVVGRAVIDVAGAHAAQV